MAKYLMIQGTTSNAGKTTICAGLCRILSQDGYKVAPFKAQNMGLNSFFDIYNGEMGFGQALQAYAAKIEPQAIMNPILLKPKGQSKIDVIINGQLDATLNGRDFYEKKDYYFKKALQSLSSLEKDYDIIVIEGAGSPAEINMCKPDIANMGLAKAINAPVLLVGNIELGGVFASIYGTYELLEKEEQNLVKGFIINKLFGYADLLDSGIARLETMMNIDSLGVIPYLPLDLEDEDMPSLSTKYHDELINIGIIKSRYATNLNALKHLEGYSNINLSLIDDCSTLDKYDVLLMPSTNDLNNELKWYQDNILFSNKIIITYKNAQDIYINLGLKNIVYHIEMDEIINNKVINFIAEQFNLNSGIFIKEKDLSDIREIELDKLANHLRKNLNMEKIYTMIENDL